MRAVFTAMGDELIRGSDLFERIGKHRQALPRDPAAKGACLRFQQWCQRFIELAGAPDQA